MKFKIILMLLLAVAISGCRTGKKMANADKSPLCGTQWNLTAIEGNITDSLAHMSQPFIMFTQNGDFSGNLGCNTFFGTYYKKKHKIELDYTGSTRKLCQEMEMERAMIKAIKKDINHFEIIGKTLVLYAGKEEVMRFVDSGNRVEENQ